GEADWTPPERATSPRTFRRKNSIDTERRFDQRSAGLHFVSVCDCFVPLESNGFRDHAERLAPRRCIYVRRCEVAAFVLPITCGNMKELALDVDGSIELLELLMREPECDCRVFEALQHVVRPQGRQNV